MKKFFAFVLLLAVALLSACSSNLTELPASEAEAEVEVQIITSVSDSETIDYLAIRDSAGTIVVEKHNFLNRVSHFHLNGFGTYELEVGVSTPGGEIFITRDVTVQETHVDLMVNAESRISVYHHPSSSSSTLFLGIRGNRVEKSGVGMEIPLQEVVFTSNGLDVMDVGTNSFADFATARSTNADGADVVHFYPMGGLATGEYNYGGADVVLESHTCHHGSWLGHFEAEWESDSAHVVESYTVVESCKG